MNNLICIEDWTKPLKGIGSYKLGDLTEMCGIMNIKIEKKMKKKDLYMLLSIKLNNGV